MLRHHLLLLVKPGRVAIHDPLTPIMLPLLLPLANAEELLDVENSCRIDPRQLFRILGTHLQSRAEHLSAEDGLQSHGRPDSTAS